MFFFFFFFAQFALNFTQEKFQNVTSLPFQTFSCFRLCLSLYPRRRSRCYGLRPRKRLGNPCSNLEQSFLPHLPIPLIPFGIVWIQQCSIIYRSKVGQIGFSHFGSPTYPRGGKSLVSNHCMNVSLDHIWIPIPQELSASTCRAGLAHIVTYTHIFILYILDFLIKYIPLNFLKNGSTLGYQPFEILGLHDCRLPPPWRGKLLKMFYVVICYSTASYAVKWQFTTFYRQFKIRGAFQTYIVQAFKIVLHSWEFSMLFLYILWDHWPIFIIPGWNQQLQQQLEEIPREETSTLQIGSVGFHQDNAPVHNSILVTDYLTKMGIKTVPHPPYRQDFAPCDFWLFPKLRDNWGDERGCDEGHWYAHTRGLQWGLPEVVWMVQQEHCNRRRLLRRGLEFHVCTINKSAHMEKEWKLI